MVSARSNENRRAYAKKRLLENAQIAVPERVQYIASLPILFDDDSAVIRFRRAFSIETLESCAISDQHLEPLSRLPPYPPDVIQPIDFEKDQDALCGALHGYQLRKYRETQHEQLREYHAETKLAVSSALLQQFHRLHEHWKVLARAQSRYWHAGDSVSERLCSHNAHWTAKLMVFIKEDLQALVSSDDSFVNVQYNRMVELERLYDS